MNLEFRLVAMLPGGTETTASVDGETLTVSGVDYDLSGIEDGGAATPQGDHPFIGEIIKDGGVISASLIWYYDPETAVNNQGSVHPTASVTSGSVPDPVTRMEA